MLSIDTDGVYTQMITTGLDNAGFFNDHERVSSNFSALIEVFRMLERFVCVRRVIWLLEM